MKKKWLLTGICTILLFTLSGCWNRRELNELGIVTMMGIDKIGKQYLVTVQMVNPGEIATQKGGGNRSPVSVYQEKSYTLFQAIRRMSTQAPRSLYFSHLRMLVIGDSVAKEGLKDTLDLLSRDHEFRTDFYIAVARQRQASDILRILTPVEKIPSQNLYSKLDHSESVWAATGTIKLDEILSNIMGRGKGSTLTGIQLFGDKVVGNTKKNTDIVDSPAKLKYTTLAAFKDGKMVGWLTEDESKGFNYTQNGHIKSTIIQIKDLNGKYVDVELSRTQTKTKVKIVNHQPQILISIRGEGNVAEVESPIDIANTDTVYRLESKVDQDIKQKVASSFQRAKELKTDIFGFGEMVHRSYPKEWRLLKNNWNEKGFLQTVETVHVDIKLRRVGTINNPINKQME